MADDYEDKVKAAFAGFHAETRILDEPQFTRRDVLEVTGLTDAQLKNTLDRNLVRLASEHNPGTGRRRMFTGGDVLKLVVAHTMSAVGFPMRWSYLVADEIERRARGRLIGLAGDDNLAIITYPAPGGDWVRIPITGRTTEKPNLPVAYQIIEVDRLIDETLAKLRALVAEEPLPDFSVPVPEPEPSPYSPENDFFRMWDKDAEGRDVLVGLTYEESQELSASREAWLRGEHKDPDRREYLLKLQEKHEIAWLTRPRGSE